MNSSKLLINEEPLQVLPSLAAKIGLNEAILLQQIHYWLRRSKHVHDGKTWIYNTHKEWKDQLPWLDSEYTIMRLVKNLRAEGLIETTRKYNSINIDQTLWYTINYERLEQPDWVSIKEMAQSDKKSPSPKVTKSHPGTDILSQSTPVAESDKMSPPIPREDQENTNKRKTARATTPQPANPSAATQPTLLPVSPTDSRSAAAQPALLPYDIPIDDEPVVTKPIEPTEGKTTPTLSAPSLAEQFRELHARLKTDSNRNALLRDIYVLCYGEADAPSFSRLGMVAKKVGGAGRLADLLWQFTSRPPTGDVLSYLEQTHKNREQDAQHRAPEVKGAKSAAFNRDFQGSEA